jgi:hypothetical protein
MTLEQHNVVDFVGIADIVKPLGRSPCPICASYRAILPVLWRDPNMRQTD